MSLIIKHSEVEREIIYNASEADEPLDKPCTYVHLMPIELDRIKNGTSEEVQKILRRYI